MKKFYYFLILQIIFYTTHVKTSSSEEKSLIEKIENFHRLIDTKKISEENKNTYTKFIQLKGRAYNFYFEKNHKHSKSYRAKKQLLLQAIKNAQTLEQAETNIFCEALCDTLLFANSLLKNKCNK